MGKAITGFVRAIGFCAFTGWAGCSATGGSVGDESEIGSGDVAMQLKAVAPNGNVYRLRKAVFSIAGPALATLDSEANPDATTLTVSLPPGPYSANLGAGWQLERLDPLGGSPPVVNATLVSPNPAAFSIASGTNTPLVYSFKTDGTIVNLGPGTLDLSIGVSELDAGGLDAGGCTIFDDSTCVAPQWCMPINPTTGSCTTPGFIPIGFPCIAPSDCVKQAICMPNPTNGITTCVQICDTVKAPTCTVGKCTELDPTLNAGFDLCEWP